MKVNQTATQIRSVKKWIKPHVKAYQAAASGNNTASACPAYIVPCPYDHVR